ncbi:MAG: hypothetical protein ACRD15_01055, partial [Vicinamibacterales bacterium]
MSRLVSESHIATQQWQSFELRMRQRRAERCVLRATAALELGVLNGAREALEEAQSLTPDEPAIQALFADLKAAELVPAERPTERSAVEASSASATIIAFPRRELVPTDFPRADLPLADVP